MSVYVLKNSLQRNYLNKPTSKFGSLITCLVRDKTSLSVHNFRSALRELEPVYTQNIVY